MRKSAALIVATVSVAVLAGCSPASPAAGCDPITSAGDASTLIATSGDVGTSPTVRIPTPIFGTGSETSATVVGEGRVLQHGDIADVEASLYLGETGELLTATEYSADAAGLRLTVGEDDNVMSQVLQCQTVGSRLASILTIADIYGDAPLDPSLGIDTDDTVVLVSDIRTGYPGKADGAIQSLASGFPAVVTAPDGTPGISFPNELPPTELGITALRVGDGATVQDGDQAVVHYTGVLWDTQEVFDSSWERNQPATFVASAMDESGSGGLVPGFAQALIGATVGSQILVVIPPEFGYPAGSAPASVPEGSTMVFVLDILGIE